MKYIVKWRPDAIAQVTAIVHGASNRGAIMKTIWQIEALLAYDPMNLGESRQVDTERVLFEPPLLITFDVNLQDEQVDVADVRQLRDSPA